MAVTDQPPRIDQATEDGPPHSCEVVDAIEWLCERSETIEHSKRNVMTAIRRVKGNALPLARMNERAKLATSILIDEGKLNEVDGQAELRTLLDLVLPGLFRRRA